MAFELTEHVKRRLTTDEVAWLTTVTPAGKPAPMPVWFVWDGQAIIVYNLNTAARLRNIEHNPQVTLNFNSNGGGDIVVVAGTAQRLPDAPPPTQYPGLLDKYARAIGQLGQTPQWYDDNYREAVRITPDRWWGHE
jgi:PPOX class probable F420-dependent enzyme